MFYYFRFVLYQLSKNLNRPFFMDFLTQLRYNNFGIMLKKQWAIRKRKLSKAQRTRGLSKSYHLQLQLLPLQAVHMPKLCLLVAQQWKCCCQAFSCDYGQTSKKKQPLPKLPPSLPLMPIIWAISELLKKYQHQFGQGDLPPIWTICPKERVFFQGSFP